MLNVGSFGKKRTDDPSPLGKELRFPESDRVIFKRSPADRQQVGIRTLDSAVEMEGFESRCLRQHLLGFLDGSLKVGFQPGFDGDKGGLHDHGQNLI